MATSEKPKKKIPLKDIPPKKIKILYTNFDVILAPLNEWNVEPDLPLWGKVEWEQQAIYLDDSQALDLMRETLWHEVKHVAWQYANLPRSLYISGRTEEEDVVARLAVAEITIMRENPDLMRFILG